jgi:hypothetical protein
MAEPKKPEHETRILEVELDPAMKLDDAGYVELVTRIEDEVLNKLENPERWEATLLTLEVRTSDVDTSDDLSQHAE